jgi:hypothetical protein
MARQKNSHDTTFVFGGRGIAHSPRQQASSTGCHQECLAELSTASIIELKMLTKHLVSIDEPDRRHDDRSKLNRFWHQYYSSTLSLKSFHSQSIARRPRTSSLQEKETKNSDETPLAYRTQNLSPSTGGRTDPSMVTNGHESVADYVCTTCASTAAPKRPLSSMSKFQQNTLYRKRPE